MFRLFSVFTIIALTFYVTACQPAPEPEKPKGVLRIATIPTDMPIIVNGQLKGNSPSGEGQYFSISLEEGEHKIEILKSIDKEKEQYAEKTLFLAADTIPIVTLEAKERLTPFGEEEKARREAEAAEKARLAEIERKKAAAIAKEKARLAEIQKKKEADIADAKAAEKKRLRRIATEARKILEHESDIYSVAFSPDSQEVITGDLRGNAKLWNISSGNNLYTWDNADKYSVRSARFSPDGKSVLTGGDDNTAKVWDKLTGRLILSLSHNNSSDDINSVAFSPNGAKIITAADDDLVKIWAIDSGTNVLNLEGHSFTNTYDGVLHAEYSPDGRKIVTIADDGTVKLWDALSGDMISLITKEDRIYSASFSPDSKMLVTANPQKENGAVIWNLATSTKSLTLKANYPTRVAFSPDGTHIATSLKNNTIQLWNAKSGELDLTLTGHKKFIRGIAYSPNGQKLVSGGDDHKAIVWDVDKEMAAERCCN